LEELAAEAKGLEESAELAELAVEAVEAAAEAECLRQELE